MEGTHENPKWPSPTYEDVRICVSLIASDPRELAKPVKPAAKRTKLKKKSKQKTSEPAASPPPAAPAVSTAKATPVKPEPVKPEPIKPAKFFKQAQQTNPKHANETTEDYARRLHRLSEKTALTRPWEESTFLRRLRDQEREARVQKAQNNCAGAKRCKTSATLNFPSIYAGANRAS